MGRVKIEQKGKAPWEMNITMDGKPIHYVSRVEIISDADTEENKAILHIHIPEIMWEGHAEKCSCLQKVDALEEETSLDRPEKR